MDILYWWLVKFFVKTGTDKTTTEYQLEQFKETLEKGG